MESRGLERVKTIIFPCLTHCHKLEVTFGSSDLVIKWFPLLTGLRRLTKLFFCMTRESPKVKHSLALFSGEGHGYKLEELMLHTQGAPIHPAMLGNLSAATLIELRLGKGSFLWDDIMPFLAQCQSL